MSTKGSWVIGYNMAGYLPDSPENTTAYADRDDAATALADLMRDYADRDDDDTAEALPTDPAEARAHGYTVTDAGIDYGDDEPTMRATVDSLLADYGPDRASGDWSAYAECGNGIRIAFWIMWADDRQPDDDNDPIDPQNATRGDFTPGT